MRNWSRCWLSVMMVLLVTFLAACQAPVDGLTPDKSATGVPPAETSSTDYSYLKGSDPATVDNSDLLITPIEELGITGAAPEVDIAEYRLTVDGLVETPLIWTYEALLAYPTVTEVVLLVCPGFFADNAEWTGVPVTTFLAETGIKSEASEVTFQAMDKYRVSLTLEEVQRDGVFLAHTVNGEVLPLAHGYPLRLVFEGEYGSQWIKWVERIEVK